MPYRMVSHLFFIMGTLGSEICICLITVIKGQVTKWHAILEMMKLYAGDSGITLTQARLNIMFLNNKTEPPEKSKLNFAFLHTDKKDEQAAQAYVYCGSEVSYFGRQVLTVQSLREVQQGQRLCKLPRLRTSYDRCILKALEYKGLLRNPFSPAPLYSLQRSQALLVAKTIPVRFPLQRPLIPSFPNLLKASLQLCTVIASYIRLSPKSPFFIWRQRRGADFNFAQSPFAIPLLAT